MAALVSPGITKLVGNTPLLRVRVFEREFPRLEVYAKAEWFNPGGSVKDRAALSMIEDGERRGALTHDKTIIDSTSGNTGIAYAMVAAAKGYRVKLVMPANVSAERKALVTAYGAEIVYSDAGDGSDGAIVKVRELVELNPRAYFYPDQYSNPANPRAHYEGTGAEIADALERVDVLVAGLGTGGTLMGTGERLRESFPDIVVAAAEPLPGDPVMGLRSLEDGYVPPILDVSKLDRKVLVSNEESVAAVHALLDCEGIFAGISSGAAVHVAQKLAAELAVSDRDGGVVVCVLADAGWKYHSADFWDAGDVAKSMERTLWW
jgi:cysteine synthase B